MNKKEGQGLHGRGLRSQFALPLKCGRASRSEAGPASPPSRGTLKAPDGLLTNRLKLRGEEFANERASDARALTNQSSLHHGRTAAIGIQICTSLFECEPKNSTISRDGTGAISHWRIYPTSDRNAKDSTDP